MLQEQSIQGRESMSLFKTATVDIGDRDIEITYLKSEPFEHINAIYNIIIGRNPAGENFRFVNSKILKADKCLNPSCKKRAVEKRVVEMAGGIYKFCRCRAEHVSITDYEERDSLASVQVLFADMNRDLFNSTDEYNFIERDFKHSFLIEGDELMEHNMIRQVSFLVTGDTKKQDIKIDIMKDKVTITGSDFNRDLIDFLSNHHLLVPLWLAMYSHSLNYPLAQSLVKGFVTHSIRVCARAMQLNGNGKVDSEDISKKNLGSISEFYSDVFNVKKITQHMTGERFEQLKAHTRGGQKDIKVKKAMAEALEKNISLTQLFSTFGLESFSGVIDIVSEMQHRDVIYCKLTNLFITLIARSNKKFMRELKKVVLNN